MAVTNEFTNAVTQNDVRLVRIMLKDSLVVDPTFAEFDQMISLAETMNGLFDAHDGETLNYDVSSWTKDYMDEEMVQVVYNFSKERLDLLKSICKHLFKHRAVTITSERKSEFKNSTQPSRKQIGAGIAVAGAATAITGAVISQSLLIGAGVVAVVVGGAMIITDK